MLKITNFEKKKKIGNGLVVTIDAKRVTPYLTVFR